MLIFAVGLTNIVGKMRRFAFWLMVMMAASFITACQQEGKRASTGGGTIDSSDYYLELADKGVEYYRAYNVDSFADCNNRIHQYLIRNEQRQDEKYLQLKAHWLTAEGVFHSALLGRPDSGIVYTDSAIRLMERLQMDPELRVITMQNKGNFYSQTGQFDLSADAYLRAMAVADSFHTSEDSRIAINLGIATVYTFMGDFTSSGKWWSKSRELLPEMTKPDQFIYYNNVGNDYYLQGRYREALPCFEKAASLVKDDPDKSWDYYTARANIAEILINLKEAEQAQPILHEADSFFRKIDSGILLYYTRTSEIELATLEGRHADATQMVRESKTPEGMIPAAVVMRLKAEEQAWREAGNISEAYKAHQTFHRLNDSIQSQNLKMQMNARMMEYEHDKRLLEQQQQIERSEMNGRMAWALFVVALLTAGLLLVLYQWHRHRGRMKELELRQQLIETRLGNARNRLSPHFIYNALNHEMLSQMEGRPVDFNALTQLLRRGLAMADTLITSLRDELAFVDYYAAIEGQQLGPDFRYSKHIDEGIDTGQVSLPAMTIQIFVENAIKHGLRPMKPEKGEMRQLAIHVSRQGQATLVEVTDNGQGLKNGPMSQAQTGMKVVRQTIQMLNEGNHEKIDFGVTDLAQEGRRGCRSWILLPDHFDYHVGK